MNDLKNHFEKKEEEPTPVNIKASKRDSVYKMPQSMLDNLARAREGRPDDFKIVTIS